MKKNKIKDPFGQLSDRAERHQKLAATAKQDALSKRPSTEDSSLIPGAVMEARGELKDIFNSGVQAAQVEFQDIEERIDVHGRNFDAQTLKHKAQAIIETLTMSLQGSPSKKDCEFHMQNFQKRKDDLERFKLDHNLIYEPQRGINNSTFLGLQQSFLFLVVLYLVEAIFNAALFVGEIGMIGGLTISLSSSLVNVVVGFLVGRFLWSRMYLGKRISRKIIATIGVASFIAMVVYMNFVIAMYRTLKAVENSAFQSVNTSDAVWPFPYLSNLDFNSLLVLLVGFVFAIAALLDGYFSDEPYPGYGQKYRLCLTDRANAQAALADYKAQHSQALSACRRNMEDLFNLAGNDIQEWSASINTVQKRFVDFSKWTEDLIDADSKLWDTYRSEHAKFRISGYQTPAVFDSPLDPPLINDSNKNADHVFRDAAQLYMSDEDRLNKVGVFKVSLTESRETAEALMDAKIKDAQDTLEQLNRESACHI